MKKFFLLLLLVSSCAIAAPVAPKKITAVYDVTRKGQPFATVNETFVQEGGRYKIESITSGIGVSALFGKRRLASEGEITENGLHPAHFEQQQGEKKGPSAEFDWTAKTLTLTNKGKTNTSRLEPGTQDLASYAYQFMFQPPAGEELALAITTGKKVRTYRYRIVGAAEPVDELKTVHLVNVNKTDGGEEKELWLAADKYYVPAKIITFDDAGAKIEQVLTSLMIE